MALISDMSYSRRKKEVRQRIRKDGCNGCNGCQSDVRRKKEEG
ncbi:hypothetical protein QUA54_15080 [Microcoleus sp. MOSTC5]